VPSLVSQQWAVGSSNPYEVAWQDLDYYLGSCSHCRNLVERKEYTNEGLVDMAEYPAAAAAAAAVVVAAGAAEAEAFEVDYSMHREQPFAAAVVNVNAAMDVADHSTVLAAVAAVVAVVDVETHTLVHVVQVSVAAVEEGVVGLEVADLGHRHSQLAVRNIVAIAGATVLVVPLVRDPQQALSRRPLKRCCFHNHKRCNQVERTELSVQLSAAKHLDQYMGRTCQ
jgi:hypothetical protein